MPSLSTSPYPTAEDVLIAARVMANDAILSIDGDILNDDQPYMFPMLQLCYEKLQKRLVRGGMNTYNKYAEVTGLTPVGTSDPTTQVQLMYSGYYDGAALFANPTLPPDLIVPLEIWERQTATINRWSKLGPVSDSITTSSRTSSFQEWDWENDVLFLPGATQSNDLRMKYIAFAPELTGPDSQVFVVGCKVALAALIGEMAAKSRGGTEAAVAFKAESDNEIQLLLAPYARKEQYASFVRRPFRGNRRGRWSR
jgi:hypothetical protein